MAVVFDGISGDHWCPFVILITNNTTLVELAKPREHIDPDLVIHVQQIDHHPVLADQAVLDPPEIEASHGDFLAERRDAQPAVMADGLDHVRPAGHGGVIIVTEEVIGDLGGRHLDMEPLDLLMALRAVTYVGWIVPRMEEPGSATRNTRFIKDAQDLCWAYLQRSKVG